jgi:hypothetical protein
MKIVIRTVFFHFCCILFFGLIYLIFKDGFSRDPAYSINNKKEPEVIDCLFLATTVQAGVGYSDLYPITNLAKTTLIIQQFIMISTNVFLLYIFTL